MRTITIQRARTIAQDWYSPSAPGLVALATSTRILPDADVLDALRDVAAEIDEHPHADDLRALHRWLTREAAYRGL